MKESKMKKLSFWEKRLREQGFRCTKQRSAILNVLIKNNRPLTAREIFLQIKNINNKFRLSTVYRNLNFFQNKNIVNRVDLNKQEGYFELLNNQHHHHLVCINCGEIKPLDCPLRRFQHKLSNKTNYTIVQHNMKMFGICPKCKNY